MTSLVSQLTFPQVCLRESWFTPVVPVYLLTVSPFILKSCWVGKIQWEMNHVGTLFVRPPNPPASVIRTPHFHSMLQIHHTSPCLGPFAGACFSYGLKHPPPPPTSNPICLATSHWFWDSFPTPSLLFRSEFDYPPLTSHHTLKCL